MTSSRVIVSIQVMEEIKDRQDKANHDHSIRAFESDPECYKLDTTTFFLSTSLFLRILASLRPLPREVRLLVFSVSPPEEQLIQLPEDPSDPALSCHSLKSLEKLS